MEPANDGLQKEYPFPGGSFRMVMEAKYLSEIGGDKKTPPMII